jgi:hypothetical protein
MDKIRKDIYYLCTYKRDLHELVCKLHVLTCNYGDIQEFRDLENELADFLSDTHMGSIPLYNTLRDRLDYLTSSVDLLERGGWIMEYHFGKRSSITYHHWIEYVKEKLKND